MVYVWCVGKVLCMRGVCVVGGSGECNCAIRVMCGERRVYTWCMCGVWREGGVYVVYVWCVERGGCVRGV